MAWQGAMLANLSQVSLSRNYSIKLWCLEHKVLESPPHPSIYPAAKNYWTKRSSSTRTTISSRPSKYTCKWSKSSLTTVKAISTLPTPTKRFSNFLKPSPILRRPSSSSPTTKVVSTTSVSPMRQQEDRDRQLNHTKKLCSSNQDTKGLWWTWEAAWPRCDRTKRQSSVSRRPYK